MTDYNNYESIMQLPAFRNIKIEYNKNCIYLHIKYIKSKRVLISQDNLKNLKLSIQKYYKNKLSNIFTFYEIAEFLNKKKLKVNMYIHYQKLNKEYKYLYVDYYLQFGDLLVHINENPKYKSPKTFTKFQLSGRFKSEVYNDFHYIAEETNDAYIVNLNSLKRK